jgi:hypothetical protein
VVPALILVALLVPLSAFYIALAAGVPWGHLAWNGQGRVLTARLRRYSGGNVVVFAGIALVELSRVGVIPMVPATPASVMAWVVVAFFLVGAVIHLISPERLQRLVMAPAWLVLAALGLLVALT